MKIFLFSYGLVGGGAERIASVICNGLVERGHEVTIVSHRDIEPVYNLSPLIRKLYYPVPSTSNPIKRRLGIIKSIRRMVKEYKPAVSVGLMRYYAGYLLIATLGLKAKVVAWDHSSFRIKDLQLNAFWRKYLLYALFDRTFVLTEEDRKDAWFKRNIRVIPNALSFSPVEKMPTKKKIVLGVGNFNSWHIKGFDILIQAWYNIESLYPEWKLMIVGGGNHSAIKKLIEDMRIQNRVTLCGFLQNVKDMYLDASVFVLSSRQEGFPLVLLEAMSQGCACIACGNHNRTSEMLGKNGLIYETGSVDDLAQKLKFMLAEEDVINNYGRKAISASQKFSVDKILDKWEHELSEIIENA